MAVNKFKDLNDVMHMQGFQNLVKGIQAQNMVRVSLFEVIERKWKFFIAVLPENEKEQVSTFIQCLKDKNIKRIFTCTKGILLDCGHGNCETLLERLMNLSKVTALQENMGDANEAEIGKNETETAENSNSYSDSCFSYYWELARLFIGVSIDDNIHLRDGLDSMALIKLMKNCRLFKFKDSDKVYDQVCEDRDAMVYAPDMQISKNQLNNIIRNLQIILGNFSESFVSCSDATTYLSQLEPEVVNYDTIEYKLLVKNVFEAIDSALRLDKEMDFYGIKGRSEAWLASREEISSLLLQVNELLSEPEPDEVSELKTENENLKKEVQKTRNDLDSKCEVFQKEIKRLERENERLRRQLEAMEELLSEPKPDIVSELKMENENLKKEVQTTKTELDSKERLEQLNEVKATRNRADNLQSRMKKLELDREWFDTENRTLKETVKRLERERDDYKQKVHRLSGQSASDMEVTIGGSKVLHEKELLQGQKLLTW